MHLLHSLAAIAISYSAGSVLGLTTNHGPLVLHEKREVVSQELTKRSNAPQDLILPMHIGVASRNADLGHDILMDVSDPDSKNFGNHWTPQEVHDFFSPDSTTVHAIQSWLSTAGIGKSRQKISHSHGSIHFKATVSEVESLLGTQYELYENADDELFLSCDAYHLPNDVKHYIDFVSPTVGFASSHTVPELRRRSPQRVAQQSSEVQQCTTEYPEHPEYPEYPEDEVNSLHNCSRSVTPACIRALYEFPENCEAVPGNDLGIYEEGSAYNQPDLSTFFEKYYPRIPGDTHPVLQSIDGGQAPHSQKHIGDDDSESLLDFQLAYPIVYPQPIRLYQNLDRYSLNHYYYGLWNSFLDALDASYCTYQGGDNKTIDPHFPHPGPGWNHTEMCGTYKPTNVISISYGLGADIYSPASQARQCHEYLKLGLQGTSLIFSSGDNGTVGRAPDRGCLAGGKFRPQFPASCPYVTAVGATTIWQNASVYDPEVAAFLPAPNPKPDDIYTSGGGFSDVFSQPSYQKDAVSCFLDKADMTSKNLYNSKGRAYPDVSANGQQITIVEGGKSTSVWGTSASAPIFASIINRINGERIKAGKKSVGFLNPTLYQNPDAFNDITEGFNLACEGRIGFNVSEGWDPVTGLGTPNYPKLLDVFMKLP